MKRLIVLLLCLLLCGCAPQEYLLAESLWDDGDGSPGRTTYEYGEAGLLKAQTTQDEDHYGMGKLYERIEFEYDDHGELLYERVFDETACIHVYEYVNVYDGEDRLVQSDSYRDGALCESWVHTYEDGVLIQTEFVRRSEYSTDTIVETFDEKGRVLRSETTVELNGTTSTGVTGYFYDGGQLTETQTDDGRRTVYSYDAAGKLIEYVYFIAPETLDSYREFTYGQGTETEIQYAPDGTLIAKEVRTYDPHGNLIKEEYSDSDGTLWQTATHSYIVK